MRRALIMSPSSLAFWPHLYIKQLDLPVKMTSLDLEIFSGP
jgi:hypothetical protein